MRIAFLVHQYHPAVGGSERLVQGLAEGLVSRGHEATVVTSTAREMGDFLEGRTAPLPPGEEVVAGVRVVRCPYRRPPRLVRRAVLAAAFAAQGRRLAPRGRLKAAYHGPHLVGAGRALRAGRPEIVVGAAMPFATTLAAATWAERLGVPAALLPCLHGRDRWHADNPALLAALRRHHVLALTEYEARCWRAMGVPDAGIHLLGGGVDPAAPGTAVGGLPAAHGLPAEEPVVLFLGRLDPGKGIERLLAAMSRVWDRGVGAGLVLAGASTAWSRQRLAQELDGLPERRLVVRPDVSEAEKWGWLAAARVLAQPSDVDSFGLVYLEAWAAGTPVVAGRTGPQTSLVRDGEDGLLVTLDDPEELAGALDRLLRDASLARVMGARGRKRVEEEHGWDRVAERAESIFAGIVGGASPPDSSRRIADRRQGTVGPSVAAVVVTRNAGRWIEACLASLLGSTRPPDEIVVVDQASDDDTADRVRRRFPGVELVEMWDNSGFAEGNRRGFRLVSSDLVLLLNPDATLEPDALERLVEAMRARPELGAAAPKVRLADHPGVLNSTGLLVNEIGYAWDRGYLEWDDGRYDLEETVLAATGCALLLSTAAVAAVGGFDPFYFMYYEDLDLGWRLGRAGRPVRYVPGAIASHAPRLAGRAPVYGEYLDHRNRLRTLIKNLSGRRLARVAPRLAAFELLALAAHVRGRRWAALRWRLLALAGVARGVPSALAARRPRGETVPEELFVPGRGAPRVRVPVPTHRPASAARLTEADLRRRVRPGESEHDGQLGLGWHGAERWSDGQTCRWCSEYGAVVLPGAVGHLELELFTAWSQEVEVVADGVPVARRPIPPGSWQRVRIPVPPKGGPRSIVLRSTDPRRPSDSEPRARDDRLLGFAVRSVGVT